MLKSRRRVGPTNGVTAEATRGTSGAILPPTPSTLLDIRIDHGPADALGRFFLMADYALRLMGIQMTFGTVEDIVAINEANRDSWLPVVSTYDYRYGLVDATNTFVLIGRDAQGKAVTVGAKRVFDWRHTDFKTEAESLRLFFADPPRMAKLGEKCRVTAPTASKLNGMVSFMGAGWFHPSVRGQRIGGLVSRIGRFYAHARWNTDLAMAVMSNRLIDGGWADKNGYRATEKGFFLENFALGNYDGGAVWIDGDDFYDDLVTFSATLERELEKARALDRAEGEPPRALQA